MSACLVQSAYPCDGLDLAALELTNEYVVIQMLQVNRQPGLLSNTFRGNQLYHYRVEKEKEAKFEQLITL